MSHFTKVESSIKNEEALIAAARDLNLTIVANSRARGYQGKSLVGDYVLQLNGPYDVALIKNKEGIYEIHADWMGGSVSNQIGIRGSKLLQAYAIATVKMEAQARGMEIEQETLQDGTVRFYLRDQNQTTQQLKRG